MFKQLCIENKSEHTYPSIFKNIFKATLLFKYLVLYQGRLVFLALGGSQSSRRTMLYSKPCHGSSHILTKQNWIAVITYVFQGA